MKAVAFCLCLFILGLLALRGQFIESYQKTISSSPKMTQIRTDIENTKPGEILVFKKDNKLAVVIDDDSPIFSDSITISFGAGHISHKNRDALATFVRRVVRPGDDDYEKIASSFVQQAL